MGTLIDLGGGTQIYVEPNNRSPKDWEWLVATLIIVFFIIGVVIFFALR